jgi:hypothetical protein
VEKVVVLLVELEIVPHLLLQLQIVVVVVEEPEQDIQEEQEI